ncbi:MULTISPECIES: acyltransferase family protein [unclassified Carboxylicivirga]|uniref:acyltransferase family protein n=1 Tax=Carboxylicivirga TaxID=1628153 RepID=UPI003D3486B1
MKRLHYIDTLKIVAIFMVVFQHNDLNSAIRFYFQSFSVLLFFVASGFVSSPKSHLPFMDVLKKYIRHLMAPYFLISIVLYLFWFFVGRYYGNKAILKSDPLDNFIGVFYAQGGSEYMQWGIPMWFLPTLFVVVMLDYFVSKLRLPFQILATLVFPVIGMGAFQVLGYHLPWSIDIALVVYLFYFTGRIFKRIDLAEAIKGWELPIFTLCFAVHLYTSQLNEIVGVHNGQYGKFLVLMYFNAILAFIWLFALLKVVPSWKPLTWLGCNTLPILAFHLLAMTMIKGVALFVFQHEVIFTPINAAFYAVLQIFLLVPVILFLNKYLPFFVGQAQKKEPVSDSLSATSW